MVIDARRSSEQASEPRAAERQRLHVPASILLETGERRDVTIEDLSSTGFSLVAPATLQTGSVFQIGLTPGHARYAKVIWSEADRAGCEFVAPLSSHQSPAEQVSD